ncbi:MAG: hypothetical protein IJX47_04705 [Clostridia bacterium]|nr:hypothetical protein [Clostridia bacterium]
MLYGAFAATGGEPTVVDRHFGADRANGTDAQLFRRYAPYEGAVPYEDGANNYHQPSLPL